MHASGQLSARKDAAALLEALKACVDEGVAGDVDDDTSLGSQLRKAIGDAPLAEGALLVKDGESLRRRYCSLVAAGFDGDTTSRPRRSSTRTTSRRSALK